jgi:hypothetical protein
VTRLLVPIVAFALGLGGALGLAACGDDEEGLLPGNTAEDILNNLNEVEELAAEPDCTGAAAAAEEVAGQIDQLGPGVSERLKRALEDGAARLQNVVDTCEEEPVATPEPETAEVPTEETTDTVETDEDEEGDEGDGDEDGETTAPEPTEPTDTTPTTPTTPTTELPPPTDGDEDVGGGGGTGSGGIGPGRVTEDG